VRLFGADVQTRAVKGHTFGLKLSAADRWALIAFLKTLQRFSDARGFSIARLLKLKLELSTPGIKR
jgi:uncharacterized protein (DUF934 family)